MYSPECREMPVVETLRTQRYAIDARGAVRGEGPCSIVLGFASSVTSRSGAIGSSTLARDSSRSIDDGEKRLGVPPPKNTEMSGRPSQSAAACSRSSSSAWRYASSGTPLPGNWCELKSQYGHLRTHQGRCT